MPRSLALPCSPTLLEALERKNDFDIARTGRPALAVEAVSEVDKSVARIVRLPRGRLPCHSSTVRLEVIRGQPVLRKLSVGSAGDLHSVIEYLEAVRATTKRFDIRSRVRLSQAMACAAPTAHCEKVAKKYRSVVGASPTARSSPASALGPNCGALASDESISRLIRTKARKFEALFVSIWSNAAVTNIMLAAA